MCRRGHGGARAFRANDQIAFVERGGFGGELADDAVLHVGDGPQRVFSPDRAHQAFSLADDRDVDVGMFGVLRGPCSG